MHIQQRLLGRRRRNQVRAIAREAYICHDDPETAKAAAENEIRQVYTSIIATILIGVAIRLAIELIMYWINNMVSTPEPLFQAGEPGSEAES